MNARTRTTLRRSFSLLELLVVMAVLAVLVAVVLEGYAGMVQSTAVTTGAAMLSDALTQGRSDAVAQNTTIEVRIYDLPPEAGGAPAYDAMQLHWLKADGTTPAAVAGAGQPGRIPAGDRPQRCEPRRRRSAPACRRRDLSDCRRWPWARFRAS